MSMFYSESEEGKKIYKAARKCFRKEFRQHEKNIENSSRQNEAYNKKIYQEFRSNLLRENNTGSIELFRHYLYKRKVMDHYFTAEEKERFKYLVEQFLEKVESEKATLIFHPPEEIGKEYFESFLTKIQNPYEQSILESGYKKQDNKYCLRSELNNKEKEEIKNILKNYGMTFNECTIDGTILPDEFDILIRLLKDNTLGIDLEKYRMVFIHYIPFLNFNEFQDVLGLLGDLSDEELDIFLDKYTEKRDDDLADFDPQNLTELTLASKSTKALTILKNMIFKKGINPHKKIGMLRVISEFKEEKYLEEVFENFKASEDNEIIAKEVNEILIKKYENNKAIDWRIEQISLKRNKIAEENNHADAAKIVSQFAGPLMWVSHPQFIQKFLNFLDISFEMLIENKECLQYANGVWNIVASYFHNLNKWFGYEKVQFSKEERGMIKVTGKTIHKLSILIENIKNQLSKSEYKTRIDREYGCIGYFIRNSKNEMLVWIGSWFELWAKKGCALVCLIGDMHSEESFSKFGNVFGKAKIKTYEKGKLEWKYVVLDSMLTEKDDDTEKISDFLLEKLRAFK